MTPELLRTFLAVHRHQSYTRAAAELSLSQPAVWRQVRALESELGARLIEPAGKRLRLTDAGRTLVERADALLAHLARVEEAVKLHSGGANGRLRVGASTTPGYYLLPAALGRFHSRHPDVELHYLIENSASIERRLIANELDLGFVGGPPIGEELESARLVVDRIVCYAARGHRLARLRSVGPRELAREICVLREEGSATRRMFEGWMATHGQRTERTLAVRCPEVAKALVAAGIGYSFVSSLGLASPALAGSCVRLHVAGFDVERPITAVWRRGERVTRSMEELLELCRAPAA